MASAGLSALSQGTAAKGTAVADEFKAQQLDRAAEYGELKAVQTSGQMVRNLNVQLGNIDAIRAANHTDPTSPSSAAVRDYVESTGDEQRRITVNNITAQAREDEAGAAYMRQAASTALLGGNISMAGTLLKAGAGAISSMGD